MPSFSKKSSNILITTITDIQTIMNELIKRIDFSVRDGGGRSTETQQSYFSQGWSTLDGVEKKSLHQEKISKAIDICPYPERYSSEKAFRKLAKYVYRTQFKLLEEGEISGFLEWGGNWSNFVDMPHWQYRKL